MSQDAWQMNVFALYCFVLYRILINLEAWKLSNQDYDKKPVVLGAMQ